MADRGYHGGNSRESREARGVGSVALRAQRLPAAVVTSRPSHPTPLTRSTLTLPPPRPREKINDNKVAHVMNSELQRKYLTSVKRLMTYAQDKRKDVDPSKKVR